MAKYSQEEVLRYQKGRRSQTTVKRHFMKWRSEQNPPIPERCDEPKCVYYNSPLIWNGQELKLILHHRNGVNGDNRPHNLQLLCPNCNSQRPDDGGGNKGKVEQSEGGFAKKRADGKKDYTLPAEPGRYKLTGGKVSFTKSKET